MLVAPLRPELLENAKCRVECPVVLPDQLVGPNVAMQMLRYDSHLLSGPVQQDTMDIVSLLV